MESGRAIYNVITEKMHNISIYTEIMCIQLSNELDKVINLQFKNCKNEAELIDTLEKYVMTKYKTRKAYFDMSMVRPFPKDELIYRTAYAVVFMGEGMCAGFEELTKIMLTVLDFESKTLLAKLPGSNKNFLHYLCLVKGEKELLVLDPYIKAGCRDKGKDYDDYLNNMIFLEPNPLFYDNIIGDNGFGIGASEFMSCNDTNIYGNYNELRKKLSLKSF